MSIRYDLAQNRLAYRRLTGGEPEEAAAPRLPEEKASVFERASPRLEARAPSPAPYTMSTGGNGTGFAPGQSPEAADSADLVEELLRRLEREERRGSQDFLEE